MSEHTHDVSSLIVPESVVSKVDISRILVEAEQLDDQLTEDEIRAKTNNTTVSEPVLSRQLTDFLNANQLSHSDKDQRKDLIEKLRHLKHGIPSVHITFASMADQHSLQQLVSWLRQSVHPQIVITIGIQPSLIGGVYIRTPNHIYDFSLRKELSGGRSVIAKDLEALYAVR